LLVSKRTPGGVEQVLVEDLKLQIEERREGCLEESGIREVDSDRSGWLKDGRNGLRRIWIDVEEPLLHLQKKCFSRLATLSPMSY
jgi:hypothetical protein